MDKSKRFTKGHTLIDRTLHPLLLLRCPVDGYLKLSYTQNVRELV
jgi:hypothetical protein